MFFSKKKNIKTPEPTTNMKHIAFIMDGNGRWAKARGLSRSMGHREGCKRIKEIALSCLEYNIQVMSLFCFSTENWKRPQDEINQLFKLLEQFFERDIDELNQKGVRIKTLGDLSPLPETTKEVIKKAKEITKDNNKFVLNICLNYGGKDEIIRAIKDMAKDVKCNSLNVEDITENEFQKYLESSDLPPIDCMVRTSGEQRISNYMLWELAYAELIFVDEHWPDFKKDSLKKVLNIYASRDRRFGGIKNGN